MAASISPVILSGGGGFSPPESKDLYPRDMPMFGRIRLVPVLLHRNFGEALDGWRPEDRLEFLSCRIA